MSLAHALEQIQRPSWWNDPVAPWKNNRAARQRSANTRQDIQDILEAEGKPVLTSKIAEQLDAPLMSIRNLSIPLINAGRIRRCQIGGLSALVVAEYIAPQADKRKDSRGETVRKLVIGLIKERQQVTRNEIEEAMGRTGGGIRYHLRRMESEGLIKHHTDTWRHTYTLGDKA